MSEASQPQKLEDLEAPERELNPEEASDVKGGAFFKNAKKAKTTEATLSLQPDDSTED